jgi:hypothetical protein
VSRTLGLRIAALVVLALLVAAAIAFFVVGGDDTDAGVDESAPEFGGAEEVAAALSDAGFGCDDFELLGGDNPVMVETPFEDAAAEQGSCTLEGSVFTTIAYFDSLEDQRQYRQVGESEGCDILEPGTEVTYVAGNRWTIEPGDHDLIDPIAEEVGGRRTTFRC